MGAQEELRMSVSFKRELNSMGEMSAEKEEGVGETSYCCCVVTTTSFRKWVGQRGKTISQRTCFSFMKELS